MSTDFDFEFLELTAKERLERKLYCPVDIYFSIGTTFFLFPEITIDGLGMAFDWLWVHFNIQYRKRYE